MPTRSGHRGSGRKWPWGLLFLIPALLSAQAGDAIPSGGAELVSTDALLSAGFWSGSGEVEQSNVTVEDAPGFTQAKEVRILVPAAEAWDGQISLNLNSAVQAGDVALLYFWMRVSYSEDESGAGSLLAMVEKAGSPYTKSTATTVTSSSEWRAYSIPFAFAETYAVGGVQIKIGLGQGRTRTVQLGGLRLINYGTSRTLEELPQTEFTYGGREPDAAWRADAAARIEAHRKSDFSLTLVDAAGSPLNATVEGQLVRHAFHFGSVIDAGTLNESSTDGQIYRDKMVELFNASGPENDLKWPPLSGDWGSRWNYDNTATALEWLRVRGFFLRGHVLVWPGMSNLPNSIQTLLEGSPAQAATVPDLVLQHIEQTVQAYAPWIDEWDVLNEPYTNHTLMDFFEAENPDLMAEWFKRADEASPKRIGLYLNEYSLVSGLGQDFVKQAATKATFQKILNDGGRVTGLGFQSHFSDSSLTAIPRVYAVIDDFSTTFPNLRFRITEYDVTSDSEQLQADYIRDFMTIIFSHPQVDGFQVWGFWGGRHWRPSAAFFKEDWTPTLQVEAYQQTLAGWQTDIEASTDASGTITGRGFHGDYATTVSTAQGVYELTYPLGQGGGDYTVQLPPSDEIVEAQMLPLPAPRHWAVAYPTNAASQYVVETSYDGATWWPESLPLDGTGNVRVHLRETIDQPLFLRVVEIPK